MLCKLCGESRSKLCFFYELFCSRFPPTAGQKRTSTKMDQKLCTCAQAHQCPLYFCGNPYSQTDSKNKKRAIAITSTVKLLDISSFFSSKTNKLDISNYHFTFCMSFLSISKNVTRLFCS